MKIRIPAREFEISSSPHGTLLHHRDAMGKLVSIDSAHPELRFKRSALMTSGEVFAPKLGDVVCVPAGEFEVDEDRYCDWGYVTDDSVTIDRGYPGLEAVEELPTGLGAVVRAGGFVYVLASTEGPYGWRESTDMHGWISNAALISLGFEVISVGVSV